jgi:hypothetical protein
MERLSDLLVKHPGFQFPTQLGLAGALGSTAVCFHNSYDQVFRGAEVPVTLHVCAFDGIGTQVGSVARNLATGEAAHVDCAELGMREPGLISVAALPQFDLAGLAAGKIHLKSSIGTGFYVIWKDGAGHLDTMHEWMPVSGNPLGKQTFYLVFDHAGGRIARYGLVLMNPALGAELTGNARIEVYTRTGETLGVAANQDVPPMGVRFVYMDDAFPKFQDWLAREGALGVRIKSRNLVEPFSLELQASGDFHIHHIN